MKRTHGLNGLGNLNLLPVAIIAAAVLSGVIGCGGDNDASCNTETYNGSPHMVCRDNDGEVVGRPTPLGDVCIVDYVTQDNAGNIIYTCSNGKTITAPAGQDGQPGAPGTPGTDGLNGANGTGCTLVDHGGDYCTITCSSDTTTFWCGSTPPGGGTGGTGGSGGTGGTGGTSGSGGGTTNPPPSTGSWQVLAMGIQPSDPLFICDGVGITPATQCQSGNVDFNRQWIESRTSEVYAGSFTALQYLSGPGYSESFNGLLGAYCAVMQSSSCGPNVYISGLPVAAAMQLVNAQAYNKNESNVGFGFDAIDNCTKAVVCSLSVDRYAFWTAGMSQPMSLKNEIDLELVAQLRSMRLEVTTFSPAVRSFLASLGQDQ